jgi:hypothetical protein
MTVNLTFMRPPPVKRQRKPLNASGGFFRAIPASQVPPRARGLTSLLQAGARRAAAPDPERGPIAARAAMAADRAAGHGARESLRRPQPALGHARAERRAFARHEQARGRSRTRARSDRWLAISGSPEGGRIKPPTWAPTQRPGGPAPGLTTRAPRVPGGPSPVSGLARAAARPPHARVHSARRVTRSPVVGGSGTLMGRPGPGLTRAILVL